MIPKTKSRNELIGKWWMNFNDFVASTYSGAGHEAEAARRVLELTVEGALREAADGLLLDPFDYDLNLTATTIRASVPESLTLAANSKSTGDLMRFLYCQLIVARCEAIREEWKSIYWYFMDDEGSLDPNDPEDFETLRRAFFRFVTQGGYQREWRRDGMTFDDLFIPVSKE